MSYDIASDNLKTLNRYDPNVHLIILASDGRLALITRTSRAGQKAIKEHRSLTPQEALKKITSSLAPSELKKIQDKINQTATKILKTSQHATTEEFNRRIDQLINNFIDHAWDKKSSEEFNVHFQGCLEDLANLELAARAQSHKNLVEALQTLRKELLQSSDKYLHLLNEKNKTMIASLRTGSNLYPTTQQETESWNALWEKPEGQRQGEKEKETRQVRFQEDPKQEDPQIATIKKNIALLEGTKGSSDFSPIQHLGKHPLDASFSIARTIFELAITKSLVHRMKEPFSSLVKFSLDQLGDQLRVTLIEQDWGEHTNPGSASKQVFNEYFHAYSIDIANLEVLLVKAKNIHLIPLGKYQLAVGKLAAYRKQLIDLKNTYPGILDKKNQSTVDAWKKARFYQ